MFEAATQGARASDLLGVGFSTADPDSPIRYGSYNPLFVSGGMHRQLRQPMRTLIGAAATLFGSATDTAAERMTALLAQPPTAPLAALRRGTPVPLTRPEFDRLAAARLYPLLAEMTAAR